jgi:hypothetical protein
MQSMTTLLRTSILIVTLSLLISCSRTPPQDSHADRHPPLHQNDVATSQPQAPTTGITRAVTDDLVEILNSKSSTPADKVGACEALELMGPSAAPAIDSLIVALHADGSLRLHAGRALVAIGPPAIPALRECMNSGSGVPRPPPVNKNSQPGAGRAGRPCHEKFRATRSDA